VDTFRLTNPDGTVVAHLRGDRWEMDDPAGETLDAALLAGVLRAFATPLTPDVQLAQRVDDPATYGFTAGEHITVEFLAGEESLLALEIGRGLERGDAFVRPLGDGAVYRARLLVRHRLERSPAEWRDHTVVALDEGRVTAMDIEHGGQTWRYRRNAQEWVCLETPELLLDVSLVEQLARTLSRFRAFEIVDEPPPGAFDTIGLRVTGTTDSGVSATVEFGALDDGGQLYNLRHGDRSYRVATARHETFAVTPEDLRDRIVVRLDWREVERVRLRAGTWNFVARAVDENRWELVEPQGLALEEQALSFSIEALLSLRAFSLVDDVARADSGVDDDAALVFTIERVESSPVVLRVGPLRDGRHLVLR